MVTARRRCLGRPGNGQGLIGDYALTLTASNGVIPAAMQNFTLTISKPPRILSVNNTTFVVGTANTFTVKALKHCSEIHSELYRRPASRCHLYGQ